MWHMIVCDSNQVELQQLITLARQCFDEFQIEAQITGCTNWQKLDTLTKQTPFDIVMVAQDSVEGLNTVSNAKFLTKKMIWFSDLDFGVQAYRMGIPYFNKKPVSTFTMQQALSIFINPAFTF